MNNMTSYVVLLTKSSSSISMSSNSFPCFPFLYFAKFFFKSARSPPISKSRGRPFLSEKHSRFSEVFERFPLTCVIPKFFQGLSQFQLCLYLSSQLLHFPPTFCIFSPIFCSTVLVIIIYTLSYLTSSMMVVVKAIPTKMQTVHTSMQAVFSKFNCYFIENVKLVCDAD